jgi:S-adenosylmethionine:tRNA ribosyltransferase-isomerase
MTDFELKSYNFDLPSELIADRPVPDRHSSKLMVYDEARDQVTHSTFSEIQSFLPKNALITNAITGERKIGAILPIV